MFIQNWGLVAYLPEKQCLWVQVSIAMKRRDSPHNSVHTSLSWQLGGPRSQIWTRREPFWVFSSRRIDLNSKLIDQFESILQVFILHSKIKQWSFVSALSEEKTEYGSSLRVLMTKLLGLVDWIRSILLCNHFSAMIIKPQKSQSQMLRYQVDTSYISDKE